MNDPIFLYLYLVFVFVVACGFIFTVYIDLSNGRKSRRAREKHLLELAVATAMVNCLVWQKERQNGPSL